MEIDGIYPLVICYIAMENGHLEYLQLNFPSKNGDVFHSYVKLPEGIPNWRIAKFIIFRS